MDPNAALAQFRQAVGQYDRAPNDEIRAIYANIAMEMMRALDEWISDGGSLPEGWGPVGDDISGGN